MTFARHLEHVGLGAALIGGLLAAGCAGVAAVREGEPDATILGTVQDPAAAARCIVQALEAQRMAGQHVWLATEALDGWHVTGRHGLMGGHAIADVAIEPGRALVRLPAVAPIRTAWVVEAVEACVKPR